MPENQTRQALDLAERMNLTLVVFDQEDAARIRLAEQLKSAAA